MTREVKHFSLHRVAGTELRVVADVEEGALALVQEEEAVIRGYAQETSWPHSAVTLFVLQDLQPLIRQLGPGTQLPPGGAVALDHRPVVNVYDLANPENCHVFVNQQAMVKEGFWDDLAATRGLLAHEHAHPLAENDTTRASRRLALRIALRHATDGEPWTAERHEKVQRLIALLAEKLCSYAPREIFANQLTITSGFGDALLHLNRLNVANACQALAGRDELRRHLEREKQQGNLTSVGANLLLLIGDLRGHLDLALEVAPLYRAGREEDARDLEAVLETDVFPHLEPSVARAYVALRQHYVALRSNFSPSEVATWGEGALNILADSLAEKGLLLKYRVLLTNDQSAED